MAVLLAAPFINVLAWHGGARWLAAYGVVLAVGAVAAALSVALTVALFRTIGPKRTRLVAQIVAAIDRRDLRDRPADRGDPVLRHAVAARRSCSPTRWSPIAPARRQPALVAGARGRSATSTALAAVLGVGLAAARRAPIVAVLAALRRARDRRGRRLADAGARSAPARRVPRRVAAAARCGARNGRCCAAIPGWSRRR